MGLKGLGKVQSAIEDIERDLNDKVKAVYLTGLSNVIEGTPVHFKDGGRLRNSWSLNTSATGVGTKRKPDRNGSASVNNLYSKMPDWILGKKLYFINPMPHANVVEYGGYTTNYKENGGTWTGSQKQYLSRNGYSLQAPEGMVRINIDFMKKQIRKI